MSWLLWVALAAAQPSPAASRLVHTGHQEAAAGRWDAAIRYYEQAHRSAPGWAAPLLGLGRSALHQALPEQALAWFDLAAALDAPVDARSGQVLGECVRREQASAVPLGTCANYVEARRQGAPALRTLLAEAPALAPAWAELVPLLADPAARADAIMRGLAADPEPGTFGVLVVHRQAQFLGG